MANALFNGGVNSMDIYRAKEMLEMAKEFDDIKGTAVRVAIDTVLNATEYQLPKKPLPKGTHKGFNNFCCPSCKNLYQTSMKNMNYHIVTIVDRN